MKETVKKGKSIEEAVALALEELGIEEDNAEIEVLDEGNKGLFGLIGNKEATVKVTCKDVSNKDLAENFLRKLFEKMNVEAEINITEDKGRLYIDLSGERMGVLIGRRGETLMAIQYLTSLAVNRKSEEYTGVSIDIENYKEKREETLKKLAGKTADKVLKYRRNMSLDPMNPYERRIIHSYLQVYDEKISTYSTGEEPNRKVVIVYNREEKY